MNDTPRALLTAFIWSLATGAGITAMVTLYGMNIFIAIPIFGTAMIATGFIWGWGNSPRVSNAPTTTKQKRDHQRLSNAIGALDDDELMELRSRLASGQISDAQLRDLLDDR